MKAGMDQVGRKLGTEMKMEEKEHKHYLLETAL